MIDSPSADRTRSLDLGSKSSENVNEEYKEAFRSKSYVELWRKAQRQLGKRSLERLSSASSCPDLHHLSDFLLEPKQETLVNMMKTSRIHQLLTNYFESSFEACNVCELLLQSTLQSRSNYRKIKSVINISKKVSDSNPVKDNEIWIQMIFKEMEGFALLKNPLSSTGRMEFDKLRDANNDLLHQLTSKQKKIKRNTKLRKLCKKVLGVSLVISHTALATALLILAFHSMIGLVAVPGIFIYVIAIYKKMVSSGRKLTNSGSSLVHEQLDVAAKGLFILINDFDTMSRLVWRLYDEIEHLKAIAGMCVRNGKIEVLKEVVKEFRTHETIFLEQLEELEEHVYLCFHTINRSRRLVIEKIVGTEQEMEA